VNTSAAQLRRLTAFVSAIVLCDTTLFSVVTPLLPHYVREYELSKAGAGVLVGAYPAGVLVGSVPAGMLVSRVGARATVILSMALLAVASLGFAFGGTAAVLYVARFVQGLGGTCAWAGALAWLIDAAPVARRGELIGVGLAAAVAGGMLGPALGALAAATTPQLIFSAFVVVCGLLVLTAMRLPPTEPTDHQGIVELRVALREPQVRLGNWLVGLSGVAFGVLAVLGPLRLHGFGAGSGVIAGVFLCAAVAEAACARITGRASDRHGRLLPISVGLTLVASLFWLFTVPDAVGPLAALIVALATVIAMFWVPSVALLSDTAGRVGLQQGFAIALTNLTWAFGDMLGSGGGGALAGAVGDAVPALLVTCAAAVMSIVVWHEFASFRRGQRSPELSQGSRVAVASTSDRVGSDRRT
jgi:MFS family permease